MEFTLNELRKMAAEALFLKERLSCRDICFVEGRDEDRDMRYAKWMKKAGGNGGEKAFLKRLAVENISQVEAKKAMGDIVWKEDTSLPLWTKQISDIIELLPAKKEELLTSLYFNKEKEGIKNNDMIDAVLPFVYYAEMQLISKLGAGKQLYTDDAISNMGRILIQLISPLCFKTFMGEFNEDAITKNPIAFLFGTGMRQEDRKAAWCDFTDKTLTGSWMDILLKYPVLARFIVLVINDWVNYFGELTEYLYADIQKLEAVFGGGKTLGPVTHVEGDLSDRHYGGRSVLIITFSSGVRLVYKPRCLDIDAAWESFNAWLSREGFPYAAKTPRIVNYEDHGWVEYVNYDQLKDVYEAEEFYIRAGVLLGLTYILGGNDFHAENLIAWGKYPVLIDLETLLLHKVKPFNLDTEGMTASQMANDILSDSAVRTGLLPMWRNNRRGSAVDWGALTGDNNGTKNIPLQNGEKLKVSDFEASLLKGFSMIYDFIVENRGKLLGEQSPLKAFSNCKLRFLIRSTQVYADVLNHAISPVYLKNGLDYSFEVERLGGAYLLTAPDTILPELWNTFLSERDAIERRDIPIFYGRAESLALIDHEKSVYGGYFMMNAIEQSQSIIKRLSNKDKVFQIDLIKSSLSIYEGTSHDHRAEAGSFRKKPDNIPVLDDNLLMREAENIYKQLTDKRIESMNGDFTWIVRQFDMETQKMNLGEISLPLYDGRIGLALFMAALYRLTGREDVKQNALKTVEHFRKALYDSYNPFPVKRFPIGWGSGLGGVIKALSLMSSYMDEEALLSDAVYIASGISPEQVEKDKVYDVLGGASGMILAIDDLYSRNRDDRLLNLALLCGKHLLDSRIKAESEHRVWASGIENAPLSGLGHGAAGHAAALMKLYGMTGNKTFYTAAVEAMEYEAGLYDARQNNWMDLRKNPDLMPEEKAFMAGWCSGAPGIGLARLHCLGAKADYAVERDISNAIEFTLNCSMHSSDHICCGNSGRVDFLIEAAMVQERAELLAEAKRRLSWMIVRKEATGSYVFNGQDKGAVFNPSLFQGISGIGYELLRCISPERIKTILI